MTGAAGRRSRFRFHFSWRGTSWKSREKFPPKPRLLERKGSGWENGRTEQRKARRQQFFEVQTWRHVRRRARAIVRETRGLGIKREPTQGMLRTKCDEEVW